MKMPSETDVAPKAISGWVGMGRGYAKSTFGAKKAIDLDFSHNVQKVQINYLFIIKM